MPPRVSIVTICRNARDVIEPTLRSIHSQSYSVIEHVVVDGNSTDGTFELLRGFGPRIAALVQRPPAGIADAFNGGIELSTGDLLVFLNAGDMFVGPDVIARIAQHYVTYSWAWAYGGVRFVSPDGVLSFDRPAAPYSYRDLSRTCFVPHASSITS